MNKAEKFFDMCVNLPLPEERDDRDESSVPELATVAEYRDNGSLQQAIDYGKTLMAMHPDNDLIPFMIAYMYYQKEFPNEAKSLALKAIPNCPRKYRLYSVIGLSEFDMGNLETAIIWWSRSVVAQCTVTDFQEYDPFLHMGTAAEIIGSNKIAKAFYMMTDAIEASMPRLSGLAYEKLEPIKKSWARKPFNKVLEHIHLNYLQG